MPQCTDMSASLPVCLLWLGLDNDLYVRIDSTGLCRDESKSRNVQRPLRGRD